MGGERWCVGGCDEFPPGLASKAAIVGGLCFLVANLFWKALSSVILSDERVKFFEARENEAGVGLDAASAVACRLFCAGEGMVELRECI